MSVYCEILQSRYADSVSLMNTAREVRQFEGVDDAALVMGTDANKHLLENAGMLTEEARMVAPDDMILVVTGDSAQLEGAARLAKELLQRRKAESPEQSYRAAPRTLIHSLRKHPEANLAVISVAGAYAAPEARTALAYGLDVLLFSDNVSIAEEITLKQEAVKAGLLLMGPGAGTAILNGVALGFANAVPRGPVGIVSAAGTGLQEVSVLLARNGAGISQAIGVGGRDLSDEVGGTMTFHALNLLVEDKETRVLLMISKLPSQQVSEKVIEKLNALPLPVVVIFMGPELEIPLVRNAAGSTVYQAATLHAAALAAVELASGRDPVNLNQKLAEEATQLENRARQVAREALDNGDGGTARFGRGLFSGGTLCEEAMRIWERRLGPVWSNAPLHQEYRLPDSLKSQKHTILDLGEEEFTVGRPHPMIDNELRLKRLLQEAGDPSAALLQMDVVLGYGAHPDPASELAPAVYKIKHPADGCTALPIVLSITGTEADPQDYERQRAQLLDAGALVFESNAAASMYAAAYLQQLTGSGLSSNG
ncbi:MAG: acyl-CoA synthetase FdrA [Anaerolineales bacterium]|nr:acyl-CoA synthetase FdrA [Anaerolineales bacterium]